VVIFITLLAGFILYFRLRSARNWEYLLPGCLGVKDRANTREDQVGSLIMQQKAKKRLAPLLFPIQ
jgi:hypothetical protein